MRCVPTQVGNTMFSSSSWKTSCVTTSIQLWTPSLCTFEISLPAQADMIHSVTELPALPPPHSHFACPTRREDASVARQAHRTALSLFSIATTKSCGNPERCEYSLLPLQLLGAAFSKVPMSLKIYWFLECSSTHNTVIRGVSRKHHRRSFEPWSSCNIPLQPSLRIRGTLSLIDTR
jgi:hypothetical protein